MPISKDVYCAKEKFISDPGDRYRPIFTSQVMDDGTIELVQTGVEDLQEIYNSQRETCDVSILAERYLAGDESALHRGNPVFLDLLGMPKTLMEAYQLQKRAEDAFYSLPVEVRDKFGQDFGKFLAGAGSPEWFDALKMNNPNDLVIEKESEKSES